MNNSSSTPDITVNLEQLRQEAEAFVRRNKISALEGRKCVDGRYLPNTEDSGMIARAGGDFGYVMVLLALNKKLSLNLTSQQCVDLVYDFVTANEGTFYMHTDHHADPVEEKDKHENRPIIGCGHAAKAASDQYAPQYDLEAKDVQEALEYVKSKDKANLRTVNLPGEHAERGVLVNNGMNQTVNPSEGEIQYFLYDAARDIAFMNQLVEGIGKPEIIVENFKQEADLQTQATLKILAMGKPIFQFDADQDAVQVALAGKVE